jgi:aspartate kinase
MEKMIVSGVAADPDAARVAVVGLKDEPGVAFKLFNALAKQNINIDMILQSIGRHGKKDISFTCTDDDADTAKTVIEEIMDFEEIDIDKNVAKVSIVGAGMQSHPGVAAKMFEALFDANINIRMISTSEIRVTVLINDSETERAMNAIHDKFDLGSDK